VSRGLLSRAALRRLEHLARDARRAPPPAPRARGALYNAAAFGPLTGDWLASLLDPNDETKASAATLRGRARDLRRNNPLVARYATASIDHIIGPDGITLQALPGNSRGSVNGQLARQCEDIWYAWAARAALNGDSWDAVCRQFVEAWRLEGEALLEIVYDERLPFGLGVQLIDPDLIDADLNQPADGNRPEIVQGVQRDAFGGIAGFWLWTAHLGSLTGGRRERRFLPVDRARYLAHRPRVGMVRGITPLAPVMLRLQMLNGTQESLVVLHRIAASKMGFFSRKTPGDAIESDTGNPAKRTMDATPGLAEQLPDDTTFTAWDPGQPTEQYDPFQKSLKAEVATAVGMSYMTLTGDLSETSWSSGRLGVEAERERWCTLQREVIDVLCQPTYVAVIRQARVRGLLQRPDTIAPERLAAAAWHARRWGYVEPTKDVAAVQQMLASGLTTLTEELNRRGKDVREVLTERAAELKLAAELGVPLQEATPTPARDKATTDDEAKPPLRKLA
jgi:lambda family phage portal protein